MNLSDLIKDLQTHLKDNGDMPVLVGSLSAGVEPKPIQSVVIGQSREILQDIKSGTVVNVSPPSDYQLIIIIADDRLLTPST